MTFCKHGKDADLCERAKCRAYRQSIKQLKDVFITIAVGLIDILKMVATMLAMMALMLVLAGPIILASETNNTSWLWALVPHLLFGLWAYGKMLRKSS